MSLVTRTPLALEIGHRDLTNRVTTSFTLVGYSADSPENSSSGRHPPLAMMPKSLKYKTRI
jgi:hypothetical protein